MLKESVRLHILGLEFALGLSNVDPAPAIAELKNTHPLAFRKAFGLPPEASDNELQAAMIANSAKTDVNDLLI